MAGTGRLNAAIGIALLLGAACVVFLWEPWHGPIVLSLSPGHGVDAGDLPALPLVALALAIGSVLVPTVYAARRRMAGRWAGPVSAVVLGALLLVGGVELFGAGRLVPAGGGTFAGSTQHADGRRGDPVARWSHVAVTYDGEMLRLYVDGSPVSTRAISGTIRRTADPLWIGGNHPYGEYFHGVIDEVRVYDRALAAAEVRAEMSTPIARPGATPARGLVGAYGFDERSDTVAQDASGNGNAGAVTGATWTDRGRFGGALRFDGTGETVRVPASASLSLRCAMTLAGWIRPSESQGGWRTILHRQTDAYFLMAGGGGGVRLEALDDERIALVVIAGIWFCVGLAAGRWLGGPRRPWWPPVVLFVAGSAVDAALAPSGSLVGLTLVALWLARTAAHRGEAATMYLLAAVFAAVTVASLAGAGEPDLGREDGGIARSAALGVLLVAAGVLGIRYGPPGGAQPGADIGR